MQYGKLSWTDTERVLAWFLHKVEPEQRRELMADMPQQYAGLFPDVDPGVIATAVENKLHREAIARREAAAAKLDAALPAQGGCQP